MDSRSDTPDTPDTPDTDDTTDPTVSTTVDLACHATYATHSAAATHETLDAPETSYREHIFRFVPQHNRLLELPVHVCRQALTGARPFDVTQCDVPLPAPGIVDVRLLALAGRGSQCVSCYADRVAVDDCGYLNHVDTQLAPLPGATTGVLDRRSLFVHRYLQRLNTWQPHQSLLAAALHRAGFTP